MNLKPPVIYPLWHKFIHFNLVNSNPQLCHDQETGLKIQFDWIVPVDLGQYSPTAEELLPSLL